MQRSKSRGNVFILLSAAVLFLFCLPAFSAETQTTADSVIDKMVERTAGIKSLEAELWSSNAALQERDAAVVRFKPPGLLRMDIKEGPVQPDASVYVTRDAILSWVPDQKLLSRNTQLPIVQPTLIFAFDPEQIRSCASKVRLMDSDGNGDSYILVMDVGKDSILNKSIYNRITLHVTKKDLAVAKIEVTDARGRSTVFDTTGFYEGPGKARLPKSWKSTIPGSLFFTDFKLEKIKTDREIADAVFKPGVPDDALVVDGRPLSRKEYEDAIKTDPEDVSALHNYGLLLLNVERDYTGAREQFEKVVKLRPDLVAARISLANALIASGEPDGAVSICDEILKAPSVGPSMLAQVAALDRLARSDEKALEQYMKLVDLYPADPTVYMQALPLVQGAPQKAKKLVGKYRKAAPKGISTDLMLLQLNIRLGQAGEAKKLGDSILANKKLNSWIAMECARTFWNIKDYGHTIDFYEKVVLLEPGYVPAYVELTKILGRLKQAERQIQLAQKLEENRPDDVDALSSVASIYNSVGKMDEAIRVLEKSLELSPDSPETYYNLSRMYQKSGKTDKLKGLVESLLSACPPDGKTFFTAGAIYEDAKEPEKARTNYRRAAVSGGFETFQYKRILRFYITNDMMSDAELLADSMAAASSDPQRIILAAGVLWQLEKFDKALTAAKSAIAVANNPGDLWKYRHFVAQILARKGENDKAIEILKELVAQKNVAPQYSDYQQAERLLTTLLQGRELSGGDLDDYVESLVKRLSQSSLGDKDFARVKAALVEKGKAALEKLLPLLDDEKASTVRLALSVIGEIADPSAAPKVRKFLDHDNPRIVLEAVKVLGQMKDAESFDRIVKLVEKHKEAAVRSEAAEALGNIGDKRAVPLLLKGLSSDPNRQTLWSYTQALAKIGDGRAVEPLRLALKTEKVMRFKIWIAEALARFEEKEGYNFLVDAANSGVEPDVKDAVLSIMSLPGEKAFGIYEGLFKHRDVIVRKYAAITAHQRTGDDVMPLLTGAMKDGEAAVRYGAAFSLGMMGGEKAVALLEEAVEVEKDEQVRKVMEDAIKNLEGRVPR